jgi:hypothetical protein
MILRVLLVVLVVVLAWSRDAAAFCGFIECQEPKRGRWGGPSNEAAGPSTQAATKVAFAPRGGLDLANLLRSDAPEIDLKSAHPAAVPSPAPSAGDASPDAGSPERPGKGGCGSCGIGVLVARYAGRRRKKQQ